MHNLYHLHITHTMTHTKLLNCLAALAMLLLTGCNTKTEKWILDWEDNFDGVSIDTTTWSKIPRWHPEWARKMSDNPLCYDMRNGQLILRGIVNPELDKDSSTYITGGVYTKHKRAFYQGRLEIKAKLESAKGAWPAIWLKPFEEEKYPWPSGGEIDIMEHLNYDSIAYQTVHSIYTQHLNMREYPKQSATGVINRDDYNVYAVEMYPDSVVFFINDKHTNTYPRIETDKEGQFPFDKPYYLLIDMQLGGGWVGGIDPNDLPVEMQIDWVRYYKLNPNYQEKSNL